MNNHDTHEAHGGTPGQGPAAGSPEAFATLMNSIRTLGPQERQRLRGQGEAAQVGFDAYALGQEYLQRSDWAAAQRWLRIAYWHGVPGAAAALHKAVTSELETPEPPVSGPLSQHYQHTFVTFDVADSVEALSPRALDRHTIPSSAAVAHNAALRSAREELARARDRAQALTDDAAGKAAKILAEARREAASILTDARRQAQALPHVPQLAPAQLEGEAADFSAVTRTSAAPYMLLLLHDQPSARAGQGKTALTELTDRTRRPAHTLVLVPARISELPAGTAAASRWESMYERLLHNPYGVAGGPTDAESLWHTIRHVPPLPGSAAYATRLWKALTPDVTARNTPPGGALPPGLGLRNLDDLHAVLVLWPGKPHQPDRPQLDPPRHRANHEELPTTQGSRPGYR